MDTFVVGSVGGIVRVLVGFPFDQIKINLQSHRQSSTSILGTIKSIYGKQGVYGFYQGSALSFASSCVQMGLNFCGKGLVQKYIKDNNLLPDHPFLRTYIAGFCGGALHGLSVTPVDHIRIQQLWHNKDTLRETLKVMEMKYTFHGVLPAILRDSIGMGFFFAIHEKLYPHLVNYGLPSLTSGIISGSIAGISWWGSTYPFDVVKTLMQKNPSRYPTMRHAFSVLYNELGWRGFFRGLTVCLYRAAVVNAAVLSTTEVFRSFV